MGRLFTYNAGFSKVSTFEERVINSKEVLRRFFISKCIRIPEVHIGAVLTITYISLPYGVIAPQDSSGLALIVPITTLCSIMFTVACFASTPLTLLLRSNSNHMVLYFVKIPYKSHSSLLVCRGGIRGSSG